MPDSQAADEVRAAGAVVWRPVRSGAELALVHRPKYDDWSFPKGKLDPDEHVLLAAVREVAEETALQVTLGRRLQPVRYVNEGVPKRVDYWVATVERALTDFAATNEIDQVAWLADARASAQLSYPHDVETLAGFKAGPRHTAPLILVRHASAGSKSDWAGSDISRPLDSRGKKDACVLASLLRCFGICRVISAPAERCVATVRPYAAAAGGVIEIESAFEVVTGAGSKAAAAGSAAVARLALDTRPVVICAHRENLPLLLDAACAALGAGNPGDSVGVGSGGGSGGSAGSGVGGKPLRKGEFVVLHRAAGTLAAAERHHPDGTS
jgi:8-oxo-(d)GTP phosphatase